MSRSRILYYKIDYTPDTPHDSYDAWETVCSNPELGEEVGVEFSDLDPHELATRMIRWMIHDETVKSRVAAMRAEGANWVFAAVDWEGDEPQVDYDEVAVWGVPV